MEKRDITISPFKIMIVDDDPSVIKALEKILFRKNYLFFSVNSGEEALETIKDIEPDMILLDVFMQGLSGFEVCSELNKRGITKKIPVIFLTSNDHSSEVIKGFKSGAVDYILKPFNAEELLARVQTHLALKKAREDIRMMNIIKTRFFSIMTHDIKDALTGVKGVAEFLHDELQNNTIDIEEIKKLSNFLLVDSTELYQFVNGLIKWDHIETEITLPSVLPFNAEKLLMELLQDFEPLLNDKRITVSRTLPEKLTMYTDQRIVRDIVSELLKNAIKYSYVGSGISVKLEKVDNVNIIMVEDEGVGMEKEVLENVFKLDTPHPKTIGTNNEKGIGLGLVICQAQVQKLDGEITIQSEKHHGVKVTVKIPDLE
ncbi:MAG: hybrid sensor histidine kinase/response regulator [Bacteroidetes bacterium]|nr:MAG: hybrid sensor histidine kinase/response regulator [Bacteroidota bacterium]